MVGGGTTENVFLVMKFYGVLKEEKNASCRDIVTFQPFFKL